MLGPVDRQGAAGLGVQVGLLHLALVLRDRAIGHLVEAGEAQEGVIGVAVARGDTVGDVGGLAHGLAHEVDAQGQLTGVLELLDLVDEPVVVVAHLLGGGDAEAVHHGHVLVVHRDREVRVLNDGLQKLIGLFGPAGLGGEAVELLGGVVHRHALGPLADEDGGGVAEGLVHDGLVDGKHLEREVVADGQGLDRVVGLDALDGLLDGRDTGQVGAGVLEQPAVEEAVDVGEARGNELVSQVVDLGRVADPLGAVAGAHGGDLVSGNGDEALVGLDGGRVEDGGRPEDDIGSLCHVMLQSLLQTIGHVPRRTHGTKAMPTPLQRRRQGDLAPASALQGRPRRPVHARGRAGGARRATRPGSR